MIRVTVDDPSGAGEARRLVATLGRKAGFAESDAGRLGLITTELATNLAKHATRAPELLAWVARDAGRDADLASVEVLAVDRGPGGDRAHDWLADGYTTGATPGTGLGAVRRVADAFEIQSSAGAGTTILARIDAGGRGAGSSAARAGASFGGVSVALEGEAHNGDAWAVRDLGGGVSGVLVVDGLGHGDEAARAADAAVRVFRRHPADDLVALVGAMHAELRSTRGAAVAVARVDLGARELRYVGVGNVSGSLVGRDGIRSLLSHNGTVGQGAIRPREYRDPIAPEAILVMHSDGLRGHWTLDAYRGITRRDPSLIAGVLYRDHRRGRDDVTVVVGRLP